jgi:hypothetical protein
MRDHRKLSDQDIDRLLAGRAPRGGNKADQELAAFTRAVRAAFVEAPSPGIERSHLAAAMEVSRLNTDKGDPVARPASKAHGPDPQASGLPKWRRRTVLSSLFASLFAKIAGAVVVALAATGALAAAGALPAPAQQAVATVASTVGIQLPSPHAAPTATVGDENAAVTATMTGTTSTVTSTATTVINHGNCVSYAASIAGSLGMTGSLKGSFLSGVAQDSSAVSAPVPANGTPDAHCETAILKAKAAATSPGQSGATHGQSGVTPTATTGTSHNPTGNGSTNHPSSTSNPGTSSIPTGVVPSHPTGR